MKVISPEYFLIDLDGRKIHDTTGGENEGEEAV